MPRLPVQDNQLLPDSGPLQQQASDAARSGYYQGQMIEGAFRDVGRGAEAVHQQVQKHYDQQDITNLTMEAARMEADTAVEWNKWQAQNDPNDPTVSKRFIDEYVTPRINAFTGKAQTDAGREYASRASSAYFGGAYKTSAIDAANNMATAAVDNVNQLGINLSNAAAANPNSWQAQVAQADLAIETYAQTHNIQPHAVTELKKSMHEQIAVAAVQGAIDNDPEGALRALESGEWDGKLTGAQTVQAIRGAKSAIEAEERDASSNAARADKAKAASADKQVIELMSEAVVDPSTGLTTLPPDYQKRLSEIARDGGMSPAEYSARRDWGATEARRTIKVESDPGVVELFRQRADANELTTTEIFQAATSGQLSSKDVSYFTRWIGGNDQQKRDIKDINKFLTANSAIITSTALGKTLTDSWGKARFEDYRQDMNDKWEDASKAGWTMDQFKEYANKAIPEYVFTRDQVMEEMKRWAREKKATPSTVPNIEAPELGKPKEKLSMNLLNLAPNADVEPATKKPKSIIEYSRNPETEIIDAPVKGGMPIVTKQLGIRQKLDFSNLNPHLLSSWSLVQADIGKQLPVVSAYRNLARNTAGGGVRRSQHLAGNALDIHVPGMSPAERLKIAKAAVARGFRGIGFENNTIHIDLRRNKMVFGPDYTRTTIPSWAREFTKEYLGQ